MDEVMAAFWLPVIRGGEVVARALVDKENLDRLGSLTWRPTSTGYAQASVRVVPGKWRTVLLHREVVRLKPGDPREVDHISGDRMDNRNSNLRIVPPGANQQNRLPNTCSSSTYRGVFRDKNRAKWRAAVRLDDKRHYLGSFHDEVEAARAAEAFRLEHMPYSQPDPRLAA